MALHYSNTCNEVSSDSKVARSYSNAIAVQKTPFSIEDILYQGNNSASVGGSVLSSAGIKGQVLAQHGSNTKGSSELQVTSERSCEFVNLKVSSELIASGEAEKKSHPSERLQQMNKSSVVHSGYAPSHHTGSHNSHSGGHPGHYSNSGNSVHNMYPTGPTYSDGYLHMIAPYLASTATGYKSVDPYFLSQGE